MAEEKKNTGVYGYNIDTRNNLIKQGEKYAMYNQEMSPAIGDIYDVYAREGTGPTRMDNGGLLKNTVSNDSELGSLLNERYYRNPDNLEVYSTPIVASEFLKPYRGNYSDYSEYMSEINQLSPIRSFINSLGRWNDLLSNTSSLASLVSSQDDLYDKLFELNTFGSMQLALEADKIGIVKHFDINDGLDGKVITNVNNENGEDSELGKATSKIVSKVLKKAMSFNSTRNTHYITDYLHSTYGLNAHTYHNFTYLLNVDDETGRLVDIDSNSYVSKINIKDGGKYSDWDEYLSAELQEESDKDTGYNRFINLYENPKTQSDEYKERHTLYNPFSQYLNLNIIAGESVDYPYYAGTVSSIVDDTVYEYNEGDSKGQNPDIIEGNHIDNSSFSAIDGHITELTSSELLKKTNQLFKDHKIGSLVGRFHTSKDTDSTHDQSTLTQSAVSRFGMSHGRNLLTKTAWENKGALATNDYSNPYCRVWTYHHQYHRLKDAIRPFIDENGVPLDADGLQGEWSDGLRTTDAGKRLKENGVLNANGFVNIAPTKGTSGVDIKNCMFSIENLAWKDVNKSKYMNSKDQILSPEQIGPNGGRIMWFPPYDLTFNENVSVNWNEEQFIGRGEPVVTYANTNRKGNISFTLLVDHPSIVDSWKKGISNSDDDEQTLLRFFAGCDTLDPSEIDTTDDNGTDLPQEEVSSSLNLNPIPDPVDQQTVIFYVFYPNNYSGKDDNAEDAINYLLTGKNYGLNDNNGVLCGYEMGNEGVTDENVYCSNPIWHYRVDDQYLGQKLAAGNYYDTRSFHYNASLDAVLEAGNDDATCSLAEFYMAMLGKDSIRVQSVKERFINCGASESNVNFVTNVLKQGNIKSIEVFGGASSHGYKNLNLQDLAPDRSATVQDWLKQYLSSTKYQITYGGKEEAEVSNNSQDVSCSSAKLGRYAKVIITYTAPEASVKGIESLNTSNGNVSFSRSVTKANGYETDETYNTVDNISTASGSKKVGKLYDKAKSVYEKGKQIITTAIHNTDSSTGNGKRYDYEREYFQQLSIKDPVMHKRLIDKVKYFDPAYHSITPEGFNARLTFLHQCTRQGHTIGASDSGWGNSAGNLAFGRPPICVLRLGDFFHCKIAITSMQLQYDDGGVQWDQNPEGIGIQPMKCKVDLGITFLGGSDISAPVARLQNAVSFNYYANSSLYDNRSDVMKYNTLEKKPEIVNQWLPTPNKTN